MTNLNARVNERRKNLYYLVEHCGVGRLMQIIMETLTRRQAKNFQFILGRHLFYTESSKDPISIHGIRWNKNVSCCEHSKQKLKITRGSWVSAHLEEFGLEPKYYDKWIIIGFSIRTKGDAPLKGGCEFYIQELYLCAVKKIMTEGVFENGVELYSHLLWKKWNEIPQNLFILID